MSRFTDLAGPAPEPLPGFPGVFVRHVALITHRELSLVLGEPGADVDPDVATILARRIDALGQQLRDGGGSSARLDVADDLAAVAFDVGNIQALAQHDRDASHEADRRLLQFFFDRYLVDEQGQPFADLSGPQPQTDLLEEVVPATIITATLALLKRRREGNGAPAGTS